MITCTTEKEESNNRQAPKPRVTLQVPVYYSCQPLMKNESAYLTEIAPE